MAHTPLIPRPSPERDPLRPLNLLLSSTLLLLALPLGATGCNKQGEASNAEAEATEAKALVRPVHSAPVAAFDLVHRVETVGELQGKDEVRVFAQVPERIRSLLVSEGQQVKAGQRLAVLRGNLQADGVLQAQAGLEAARARLSALQDQVRRAGALVKAGTLPRSQLEGLESQLRAAKAQERQLQAGVSQATTQAGHTVIRAPIAGIVTGLTLREGDMVAPSMPLLTVVDASALRLKLRVPERDFLRVRQDMPAEISLLATPNIKVKSKVDLVGPVVDRRTRTGLVEIALPTEAEDGTHLLPGSSVRVKIEVSRREGIRQVPAAAVVLTPLTEETGEAVAFVVEGKVAHKRMIQVGERQGSMLEVKRGLELGEHLVVVGAHLLKDGQTVSELGAPSSASAPAATPATDADSAKEEKVQAPSAGKAS